MNDGIYVEPFAVKDGVRYNAKILDMKEMTMILTNGLVDGIEKLWEETKPAEETKSVEEPECDHDWTIDYCFYDYERLCDVIVFKCDRCEATMHKDIIPR